MFKIKETIRYGIPGEFCNLVIGEDSVLPGKKVLAWYEKAIGQCLDVMVFTDNELESLRQYLNGCHQKKLHTLCGEGFTDEEKGMNKINAVKSIRNRLGLGLKDSVDVYYICLRREAV